MCCFFFFSSRRRHTRFSRDWSSDVCSSDLCPSPLGSLGQMGRGGRSAAQGCHGCEGQRSEERRVGKECRSRWWPYPQKKKKTNGIHCQNRIRPFCSKRGITRTVG